MKIYTYFQDINFKGQGELIDLWRISWSRQGYEPIVLSIEDAINHHYFETLDIEMRRIFNVITGKQITEYGMSCWHRWLAYAAQAEEKFYVSDYDAININFPITKPSDKLHLMDDACPFLASGTPKQFEGLCKAFVDVSNERLNILTKQADHYHDQDFFMYNFIPHYNDDCENYKTKYNILMTRDRPAIGGVYDPQANISQQSICHISHHSLSMLQEKYERYRNIDQNELRVKVVKTLLNITK